MNIYGYIRVSSRDQNEDRQLLSLKRIGVLEKNIYLDKQSGDRKSTRLNSSHNLRSRMPSSA